MHSRYGHTNITICWWYCADFQLLEELRRCLNTFKSFFMDRYFVNLDMMFNTTQAWVVKSERELFLGEETVAYTWSYTYLRVTFTRLWFSLWETNYAWLFRGYVAALDALDNNVHIYSSKNHELNCSYTIIISIHLHGVKIWGSSICRAHNWTDLKRLLFLEQSISAPWYNPGGDGSSLNSDWGLFQFMTGIWQIWDLPEGR